MKKFMLLIACSAITQFTFAQLKSTPVCPAFRVDILDGSVNGLYPESSMGTIQTTLPCFTQIIEEPSASGCAGVFYKDKGISFFTYRDYIEIDENFKGIMTLPIMGSDRGVLSKYFGLPRAKDFAWEAYQMRQSTLIVFFGPSGKINKMLISSKNAASLKMCE